MSKAPGTKKEMGFYFYFQKENCTPRIPLLLEEGLVPPSIKQKQPSLQLGYSVTLLPYSAILHTNVKTLRSSTSTPHPRAHAASHWTARVKQKGMLRQNFSETSVVFLEEPSIRLKTNAIQSLIEKLDYPQTFEKQI